MKYVEQDKGKKRLSIDTILDSIKKSRKQDLQPDEFIGSFSFLLDEIERQSTAKKSTAKKSTTKKSTTKKSTTKKSTTKKSTAKRK
jgi:topoisomerase IA-like protein